MKRIRYNYLLVFCSFLCFLSSRSFGQIALTADSTSCGDTSTVIHASLIGDVPTASGITADDGYSGVIPIGFTFNFYGTNYTNLLIGSNGVLDFNTSLAGGYNPWPISAALLGNSSAYNSICGPWCDIYIPAGGTITYSLIGTAPNRRFAVTWCHDAMYSCTTQWITMQIILYETSNICETHIAHHTFCTSWNGGYAIVGVQNATGSAATVAPGRDYPTNWNAVDEAWRFTPTGGGTAYTCSSITFAPIPYASSTIYWYDSSTGAYLGSGDSLPVHPHVGTTYKAMAAGCSDSTIAYIHIDLHASGSGSGGPTVHISGLTHTDPTECGLCNGTVTLYGVIPHQIDTIFYSVGGVLQPPIVDSAGADSLLYVTNLCSGVYEYFYIKVGPCISNSIPVTLARPPLLADFTIAPHPGCAHDSIFITNYSLPGGYVSVWDYGDGSGLDSSSSNPIHVYNAQGTYTVTLVYHNAYGCVADTTASVTFNHPLSSVFTPSASSVCLGNPVNFTNTSVGTMATYLWAFGDGTTATDMNPSHIYHTAGVYNVVLTVTDNIPCSASSNTSIEVVSINARTEFHDTIVCLRDSMPLITFVTVTPAGTGATVSYSWAPTNNLSSSTVAEPNFFGFGDFTYTFTATANPLGCVASDVEIIHSKFPLVLANLTASQTIAYGSSIQLNADSADIYVWTPDNGTLDNANINDPVATPVDSITTYTVIGMTTYGCRDTATITIRLNDSVTDFMPGAFSPNNDGLNDVFRPYNLRFQKLVDFRVFNRWGVEVFHTSDGSKGWDGKYNGVPQDLGVYFYTVIIAHPDGSQKTYSGSVTLLR